MDDDYEPEDEYAPIDDLSSGSPDDALFADPQDGPDLFGSDEPAAATQDGPDLFGAVPDHSRAKVVAASMRPPLEDEPVDDEPTEPDEPARPEPPAAPEAPRPAPATTTPPADADAAPLALYRRYRPDAFADVIGQEHVTDPLQRALLNNRVNHAYLFSGPRGCGKTTSARILARCLNCAKGPTPTPCGECDSCRDLARGGPGSIDVIEIDAASHGGVDDARDLRERAFFAPVNSRYKIYIVDEAHMVTTAGFNALLKLVEEPPPHVKFIFATTEPEKVIGTIRSRTHHYPFRLVPPKVLIDYLAKLCEAEGVMVEQAVLPLVVRAGAGSVRDSLSVLDQLLGAASSEGVRYDQAAALLGYTPDALLDEIIDAFAAHDASAVFGTIDKVIEVGQDPRRFAEDLLRRLRDLIVVSAVPDAATNGLIDVAADQAQRLATQVAGLGRGELTRAAEVLAAGLTEMRGTTAPRLHLEIMCARVLLPGADVDGRGLHARMDRIERRVGMLDEALPTNWSDVPGQQPPQQRPRPAEQSAPEQRPTQPAQQRPAEQRPAEQRQAPQQRPAEQRPAQQRPAEQAPAEQRPAKQRPAAQQRPAEPAPQQRPDQPAPAPQQRPTPTPEPQTKQAGRRELTAVELRHVWPSVLQRLKDRRRYTWMVVSQNAQVVDVSEGKLTLGFANPGARDSFSQRGGVDDLRQVLVEEIGIELHIVSSLGGGESPADGPHQRPAGTEPERPHPPVHATAASAPEAAPPRPDEGEISDDDEELIEQDISVADLLASQLGAEVIHEEPTT